jgi:hypothetical protein
MTSILPVNLIIPPISLGATPGGAAFHSAFTEAIQKVADFGQNASYSTNTFLSGEDGGNCTVSP